MRQSGYRSGSQTDDRRSVVSGNSSTASTLVADSLASGKTATSQLRKFTAGVGRPGLAREAREAVRTVLIAQNPLRKPPISEPLDYEKFINEKSIHLENDPQREIVLFPRDDIEEASTMQEQETSIPMVKDSDVMHAKWLLTREALRFYTSPHRSIIFNYGNFAGDYSANNESSSIEGDTLSSLVFESDMTLEEERAVFRNTAVGAVKDGYLMVVKSDPTLFDNLKAAKKRFCVLRRLEGGDISFEIRKTQNDAPKQAAMKVSGAQIKSTKKGKTVLEVESYREEKSGETKTLLLESEDTRILEEWLVAFQTAIAFVNKEDVISTCSEMLDKSAKSGDLNTGGGRGAPDTESIGSEDSSHSRGEMQPWRGRNSAARALQPPIVERRNLFSLYYRLQPLPQITTEFSTLVASRKRCGRTSSSTSADSITSPLRKTSSTGISRSSVRRSSSAHILVEFKSLVLRLPVMTGIMQQIEPFFVLVFVYDTHECRRVSEEFQVLVNGDEIHMSAPVFDKSMRVNGIRRSLLVDRAGSRALIKLRQPNKDLWLVCRVDRALSADTTGELYMRSTGDAKATAKLQKTIASSITRLAGYRQRFAWAARPLFPELRNDSLSSSMTPSSSSLSWSKNADTLQLFRCEGSRLSDGDLQRYLSDFSKLEKTNKLTIPNGAINVSVSTSSYLSEIPYRVNPSLFPLKPWDIEDETTMASPPVFQLQTFSDVANEPHSSLTNLLYVYPLSLKYDNQKSFSKARNIACTVRFVRGDDAIPEKAIVDRLSASGPLTISSSCAVQHHQQCPTFGDEIKTQLPLNLTTSDHLLFSFSHISVAGNTSVKTPEATETSVGYAWLPLVWLKERLVLESEEQEFALPVAVDLPPHYYRTKPTVLGKHDESGEVKWVDQKPLFRVRLRLISSVFTTDAKLQTFFQACDRLSSKKILGDASDSLNRTSKTKPPSRPTEVPHRSCSPIASSLDRSQSHEEDLATSHLLNSILLLSDIPFPRLISFAPIILGRLIAILPRAPSEQLATSTLRSIVSICDMFCRHGRSQVVRRFLKYHFADYVEHRGEPLHYVVCKHVPIMMREMQSNPEELSVLYRQMWLLVDLVMNSMARTVCVEKLNKMPQKERFSADMLEQMCGLLETAVPQIVAKHREMPDESRRANIALAYFIRLSMSFVDRGVVFKWIRFYVSRLDDTDYRALREYKADLLTIVCLHEHFVPLNLPVLVNSANHIQRVNYSGGHVEAHQNTTTASGTGFLSRFFNQIFNTPSLETNESDRYASCNSEWRLSCSYASNHFLTGLLMQELVACLREPKDYRKRPITLLRNLLAKHSFDKRYIDLTIQRRIGLLYAPLLNFLVDHLHDLDADEDVDATPTEFRCITQPNKWSSLDRNVAPPFAQSPANSLIRTSPLRQSSPVPNGSRPPQMPPPPPPVSTTPHRQTTYLQNTTPLAERLDDDEVQDLLISSLYVLQRLPKRILTAVWAENEGVNAAKFVRLLDIILGVFRYKGKGHALRRTAANSKTRAQTLDIPARTPSNVSGDRIVDIDDELNSVPFRVLQLVNLSQEVALIVLDVAQTLAHHLAGSRQRWPHADTLFTSVLRIHLQLVDEHWSETVRLHAIAALALFVNLFRFRLFEGGPLEPLYMLIENVLVQMASRLPAIQAAAAALLQLILRNGYEVAEGYYATQAMEQSVSPSASSTAAAARQVHRKTVTSERLGRPGAQTGVALARLLGFQSVLSNSSQFERGLACIETLVDTRKMTSFDKAVMDLLRQLRGVMSATVALKDAANDPMRLVDLHLQLADSYRGSAALRSAWFDTLAEIYEKDRWFAEASVCHAHSVAIIARELEERGDLEVDWRVFEWINADIAEAEKSRHDGSVQPAGFTPENLGAKIDKTASALTLAERFEAVGPLYRLLVPLLEKNMNFTSLVSVYAELQQTYSRAAEVRSSGKRHLGTYFRVRFFGENHFGSEHNTDWIYREAGLTSLAEFALHIKENCQRVIGHDNVQIEANELDTSKIDISVAYVQVTHVEPHAGVEKGKELKNDFAHHTNIRRFSYECAMIEGGKKATQEPSISEQILCRTFLTVGGVFPSTRRRLPVVDIGSEHFSPLEFACQKLHTKAQQIRKTLSVTESGRPLDVKGLQLLLQGAVMPTVNAGPLAYAEAFLKDEQRERYGEKGTEELKTAFRELMSSCQSAIEANESAIGADQQTYHEVLVSSFDAMHERLQVFFGCSLRPSSEPDKTPLPRSALHILDSIGGVRS